MDVGGLLQGSWVGKEKRMVTVLIKSIRLVHRLEAEAH
jgi:hypothetical protein